MQTAHARGNRRRHHRRLRHRTIRALPRPKGANGYDYMAILVPVVDWPMPERTILDDISEMVASWDAGRTLIKKRHGECTARVYLKSEAALIMLKAAYPQQVWKMFRLVDRAEKDFGA